MPKIAVLVVAAGRGERLSQERPKQYLPLGDALVLTHTLRCFTEHPGTAQIQVVINPDHQDLYEKASQGLSLRPAIAGGRTRQDSVRAGLEALRDLEPDIVLIHDAARPFVSGSLIERVLSGLDHHAGCIPVVPVADTLKRRSSTNELSSGPERTELVAAQTPQGFQYAEIVAAHSTCDSSNLTDDAAVADAAGLKVTSVRGDPDNFKITLPDDLQRAEKMAKSGSETRTGFGFDVHRFGPGTAVVLCGCSIPHDSGLVGHSDADVALHAVTDAIFGALGDGDIGSHFPPDDPRWRSADSALFLQEADQHLKQRKGRLINLDLTLICETPKIGPHRDRMRANLSRLLNISESRIGVKATTTEKLGFTGRKEGIAAQAIVTLELPALA
ncbi:bifunctional 2-C-methyl-D-erythritol 4-phosphate cytidylyltransferase/2-C-methyl-D-erythritol 2,4-cyclodiphosphate synthase [Fodinicurvata sediminis]|uniref:bifunctional 2-C-methyl-D-erythritol 4-phosphate cytidylyltransferase/2-C-methyl-D-erythritol 2,4-cyclodiphosphate synthase n=1 Tax=Fodinicurvata sediminis TaxID=1121832 RepID=UPI0003B402A9|nr:bifunctional 2-C-methyl-D-erythritol 4-phosphate cytidylyltransferase/2-C-methyl-D-erythritol 2,4-cyclodiphosphate synthase [Fodinicurvata sediminis]